MAHHVDVFISSTKEDLIEYREIAIKACRRLGLAPIAMEEFPPDPKGAVAVCEAEVDKAEAFIGLYAHRYGWQPFEKESITEMEYHWAMERGIPVYLFVIDEDANWKVKFVDDGDKKARLTAFKKHVMGIHVISKFTDDLTTFNDAMFVCARKIADQHKEPPGADIHYVSEIPPAPEPYIAHPYTLMHASRLFGRAPELNLLTDWVAKPSASVYRARILNVVAIGGMGKSALTWKWFNEDAPHEMKPLAGRMWWSFYESDAHFENFIIRALAYVTGQTHEEIRTTTKPGQREDMLFNALDQKPYLLVLDGLERILIAYARMDAARLSDDDYDKAAANYVAGAIGLPEGAGEQFVGQVQLRKAADPRAGAFLRRLATVRGSRILVSTRLYPAELQNATLNPIFGSSAIFLKGLHDDDALNLWRDLGVSGGRDELLRVFRRFDNYPLLIRALAGEVARDRQHPRDFDAWIRKNPDFTSILDKLRSEDTKSHVLSYALRNLSRRNIQVLRTLSAFRSPAGYETIVDLLVRKRAQTFKSGSLFERILYNIQGFLKRKTTMFASEAHLDAALDELEQRGLIGWDRRANRYDLHPIVRGVTWGNVDDDARRDVYEVLRGHFESVPTPDEDDVNTLDDLTPAIELYQALVGLGRYDEAVVLFRDRLERATLYRLSASRQRAELLELLFPDGLDQLPRLSQPAWQAWSLNGLAQAYQFSGQPGRAGSLFRKMNSMFEQTDDQKNLSAGLCNLSYALRLAGGLREAESAARRALVIDREQQDRFAEADSVRLWGLVLAARGGSALTSDPSPSWRGESSVVYSSAEAALRRSIRLFVEQNMQQSEGLVNAYLAQAMLWRGDFAARELADRAWEIAHQREKQGRKNEADLIRSSRLQGEAALGLGDFDTASERLHHALTRARAVNMADEELQSLLALAEMARRQHNPDEARRLLDDVWDSAERGPYRLFYADALNVLAQIERDGENHEAAIVAARRAYEKAWCDGPPFAYHWGLVAAKAHLDALGATYPDMPAFDESKFEPMPEVEIDPPD